jgi:hypothetical protein
MSDINESTRILIEEVLTEQRATRADIQQIKESLAEKRGERRVGLWVVGAVSAATSAVVGWLVK